MGKGGGAGRKTQTSSYDSNSGKGGGGRHFVPIPNDRDLREELGGVIFGATAETMQECLEGLVFGLPERHMTYVEYIEPGCPIFLFNYTDKKLHGIFEATTSGQLNINPHGWTGGTVAKTRYPAQVRVAWYNRCTPLPEAAFKPIIADCYYSQGRFLFELTAAQATQLCALFKSGVGAAPPRSPGPAAQAVRSPPLAAPAVARAPQPAACTPPPAAPQQRAPAPAAAPAPARAPAAAPPAQRPAPPKAPARAAQPLAAPAARQAAGSGDAASALAATHAAATAALARAEPTVSAAVGAHLEACAAAFASLRVEASAAAQARAETARATAEAAALRRELDALRAQVSPPARVGAASAGAQQASAPQRGRVITLGGYDGEGWLAAVECYDPAANKWEPLTEMSTQRGYAAAATYNAASGPAVLVVGGGNGARWFDSADAYDVATKQWRSCAPLSVRRGSLAAATVHDSIFVFGGGHAGEGSAVRTTTGVASTERYDAARDAWIELAPLSCGRFAIGGAALGGALYAAGGFDGTSYLETVERFDPREGVWRPLPPMPAGRRGSVALAPAPGSAGEHTLVAAGGFSGDAGAGAALFLERVEAFDARANAWRSLAELARPRAYGTAVNVDGRLILLGGLHHQAYAETLEEYDAAADVWRPLTLAGGATRKRSFVTATVVPAL